MNAIEFKTIAENGMVAIPEKYRSHWSQKKIRVILIEDENERTQIKPLLSALREIKISGPADFSENIDRYLNEEKNV